MGPNQVLLEAINYLLNPGKPWQMPPGKEAGAEEAGVLACVRACLCSVGVGCSERRELLLYVAPVTCGAGERKEFLGAVRGWDEPI